MTSSQFLSRTLIVRVVSYVPVRDFVRVAPSGEFGDNSRTREGGFRVSLPESPPRLYVDVKPLVDSRPLPPPLLSSNWTRFAYTAGAYEGPKDRGEDRYLNHSGHSASRLRLM